MTMDAYLTLMGVTQWRLRTSTSASQTTEYFCATAKNIFLIAKKEDALFSSHEELFKKIAGAIDDEFKFAIMAHPVYQKNQTVLVLGEVDDALILSDCSVIFAASLVTLTNDVSQKKILWQKIKQTLSQKIFQKD